MRGRFPSRSPVPSRATRTRFASSTSATPTTSTATSASIVRDEHEAEDVTQHVFAKLMTVLAKYEERSVPFSAWILRVARNVAVDHLRQRRADARARTCARTSPATTEDDDRQRPLADAARRARRRCRDEQRDVLVLRHVVGLSPGEIAGRLDGPSLRSTACTIAAAARCARRCAECECAPDHRLKVAA